MADVLLNEDGPDTKSDPSASETTNFENRCGMTQKQDSGDSDTFAIDDVFGNPDDLLPPVIKLEKYASSDIVFNRQVVARNLLETLRFVVENQDEVACLVTILCNLADDYEPSVRAELMEQVPHIAAFCRDNYQIGNLIQQYLVPMIIKYFTDINNQVRKTSQASLLLMVEQELINEVTLEEQIGPLILQLTEENQVEDHRTEAVTLMSKLALLVGKDFTERLFLKRFITLCLDSSFHVRKVCAFSFGDFCAIMERDATEKQLLPKFFSLCDDNVWGVRKACAEVFMPVSCVCSMETRHKDLAPIYMDLLCDQSRWVRMAAFQALGPFISTFAEPSKTGLYYNKEGVLTIVDVPSSVANRTIKSTLITNELQEWSNSQQNSCSLDSDESSISYNSCHTIVPSISDSCIQSTTCHSGNYCTVIELSSPARTLDESTLDANSDSKCSNCDESDAPLLLNHIGDSCDCDSECNCTSSQSHKESINPNVQCNSSSSDEECKISTVEGDTLTVTCNGEVDCLTNDVDCLTNNIDCLTVKDQSDAYCNITAVLQKDSCAEDHTNKVTVNGFEVNPDGELNGNQPDTIRCLSIEDEEVLPDCITDCTSKSQNGESQSDDSIKQYLDPSFDDLSRFSDGESVFNISSLRNNESAFNHFQFWRTPLPDVDIEDSELSYENNLSASCDKLTKKELNGSCNSFLRFTTRSSILSSQMQSLSCNQSRHSSASSSNADYIQTVHVLSSNCYETSLNEKWLNNDDNIETKMNSVSNTSRDFRLTNSDRECEPPPTTQNLFSAHDQDIVPPELLLRYLSMTDASRAQSVDAEIARHCAYSLPAVALTLGRRFWPCLKDTYNTLASDMQGFIMQWKVRRTLASSMHQLAVILGPEIAAQDLLPIFSGFIRDLDEVRIGILQHLAEFLCVLRPKERKDYLPRLAEFLSTDNDRNWRFRLILAEQLIPIADLYDPSDVREYLVPLSLALVKDKVSEVRLISVRVMAVMMRRMSEHPTPALTKEVIVELGEHFIHASKWLHRQLYVYLCQEFIKESSLPPDQFAEDAMPHLLYLCWDRVANVRLAIARCLAMVIWPKATFSDPNSPHCELLLQAIHTLQSDTDADVKYFANMVAAHECSCLQHSDMVSNLEEPPV